MRSGCAKPSRGINDDPPVQENPISRSSNVSGGTSRREPTEHEAGVPEPPHGVGESETRAAEEIADTEHEGRKGPAKRPYGRADDNPQHG